jgi:hypothetical protein
VRTQINALGFYDQQFQISNRGTFETDGYLVRDSGTLAFDAGPIDISGNIFIDAVAAVTEPFFVAAGTINPFSKLTGRATKAAELKASADELRSRIQAGEMLTDQEIATLVNNTILAAMLGGQPTDNLFDGLMLPDDLFSEGPTAVAGYYEAFAVPAPEPGTALGALAGLVLLARRRRR